MGFTDLRMDPDRGTLITLVSESLRTKIASYKINLDM